jgi:hypothetical protein
MHYRNVTEILPQGEEAGKGHCHPIAKGGDKYTGETLFRQERRRAGGRAKLTYAALSEVEQRTKRRGHSARRACGKRVPPYTYG